MTTTFLPALCAALLVAPIAAAQDQSDISDAALSEPVPASIAGHATRDDASLGVLAADFSVQILAGFSASSNLGPAADLDYEPFNVRGGIVLFPDHQSEFAPTGDVTCLVDLVVARPRDFGSIIAGPSVLVRKDLRPSAANLVPYVQAGGGMVYTDADNVLSQRIIGRSWEFLLQAGLGCHCRLSKRWQLDLEGSYQHISNARLASRNWGTNNLGIVVGLTRTWGP
jgi:opacity protein-like surface antigen